MSEDIRDRLKILARTSETEGEVLKRLIRFVEEEDLEEIIEARGEGLHEENSSLIHALFHSFADISLRRLLVYMNYGVWSNTRFYVYPAIVFA